jgi:hypothetical protein
MLASLGGKWSDHQKRTALQSGHSLCRHPSIVRSCIHTWRIGFIGRSPANVEFMVFDMVLVAAATFLAIGAIAAWMSLVAHRVISLPRRNRVALGKADINFGAPWRPIPRRLRHGARGHGVEAFESPLSRRPIEGLGQGEESHSSGDAAGDGAFLI